MKNSKVINIFFSIIISSILFFPSVSFAESVDSCSVVSGPCTNSFTVYTTNSGGVFAQCPNPRFSGYYCGNTNYINCNNVPSNPYSNPNDPNCTGHWGSQILPKMVPVGDGTYINCDTYPNDPACAGYVGNRSGGSTGSGSMNNNGDYSDYQYDDSGVRNYGDYDSGLQIQNNQGLDNQKTPPPEPPFQLQNPLGPDINSIGDLIYKSMEIFTYLAVLFAVLAFIWVGLQFILAQGNAEKIKANKRHLWYLIIGVTLVIGARVMIEVVINTLDATGVIKPETIQGAKDTLNK